MSYNYKYFNTKSRIEVNNGWAQQISYFERQTSYNVWYQIRSFFKYNFHL